MRLLCPWLIVASSLGLPALAQDAADVTKPTTVTLRLNDVSARQAFEELAKQSGIEISAPANFWERGERSVSIDLADQPFWLAMKDVCDKAGVSLKYQTNAARPRILLSRDNPGWTTYPSVTSGPFLVSLIGLQRTSTVDMRKPADVQRSFVARFSVFCEPRVRLLRGSLYATIEQARDDKGNSLALTRQTADGGPANAPEPMNFITSWAYTLEGRLEYPNGAGARIPVLRGFANFVAQTKSETIELPIDEPRSFTDVSRTVAGRKILVRELRRAPEEWEAVVTFSRESLPPEQWQRALFPGQTLKLVDGEGKFLTARGFGLGARGDQATFVFKFEKDAGPATHGPRIGRPVKLTWEIPTETQDLPVTFEFKDVTLP